MTYELDPNAYYVRIVRRTITVMEIYTTKAGRMEFIDKDKVWQGEVQMGAVGVQIQEPLKPASPTEQSLIDALHLERRTINPFPDPPRTYKL